MLLLIILSILALTANEDTSAQGCPQFLQGGGRITLFQVFTGRAKTTCILLFWKLLRYNTIINIIRNNSRIFFYYTTKTVFFLMRHHIL